MSFFKKTDKVINTVEMFEVTEPEFEPPVDGKQDIRKEVLDIATSVNRLRAVSQLLDDSFTIVSKECPHREHLTDMPCPGDHSSCSHKDHSFAGSMTHHCELRYCPFAV